METQRSSQGQPLYGQDLLSSQAKKTLQKKLEAAEKQYEFDFTVGSPRPKSSGRYTWTAVNTSNH